MSDDGIPYTVWSGSFRLFGVDVQCHTLSDGSRIIEAESMDKLLTAMAGGHDLLRDDDALALEEFTQWHRGRS